MSTHTPPRTRRVSLPRRQTTPPSQCRLQYKLSLELSTRLNEIYLLDLYTTSVRPHLRPLGRPHVPSRSHTRLRSLPEVEGRVLYSDLRDPSLPKGRDFTKLKTKFLRRSVSPVLSLPCGESRMLSLRKFRQPLRRENPLEKFPHPSS